MTRAKNLWTRNVALTALALRVLANTCAAADYDVSPGESVQRVIDQLKPGDTCRFAPGVYRRAIKVSAKGTKDKPIEIDGRGATFDGLAAIKADWVKHNAVVYKAKVDHAVRQLFINGQLATPARWPNMTFAERWDNSKWPRATAGTRYGMMVDSQLVDARVDFTGCVAILNIGAWQTFRRVISKHGKGSDRFHYPTDPKSRLASAKPHPVGMDRYCIYGFAALDSPGEWFYDAKDSTLYVYPPADKAGALVDGSLRIKSKVLTEAVVIERSEHVNLRRLKLHGTTFRVEDSHHCTIDNVHLTYPSTIANPFGPNNPLSATTKSTWNARRWFGESSVDTLVQIRGDYNTVRNSTVRFAEGPALTVTGQHNVIENCLFNDFDWHGLDYGFGLDLLAASPVTVRYVTLGHCGGSEGIRLPNHGKSLVEFCHLHHCGLRQSDGAIIQTSTAACAGTVIRFNWVHDHNAFHWGGNGIRGDDGSRGLIIHHNVVWRCREKGIVVKGDDHQVYHNTCVDNPRRDILLPRDRLPGKTKELVRQNEHSVAINNLGSVLGNWSWQKPDKPPNGKVSHNSSGQSDALRDIANRDFRLKRGSPLIDAGRVIPKVSHRFIGKAPDIGAYEHGGKHWTPGYRPSGHAD